MMATLPLAVDISEEQWKLMLAAAEDQARVREQIEGSVEQLGMAIRTMERTRDLMVRLLEQAEPADPEVMFVYRKDTE
jgi:hypothetical protein